MLKLFIIGNVGKDAEARIVNGRTAINFNVAHNETHTDQNGVKVEKVTWTRCTLWKEVNQSTRVADFIKKGAKVFVEGTPEINLFKDSQGFTQAQIKLNVKHFEFIQPAVAETSTGSVSEPEDSVVPENASQLNDLPY